MRTSTSTYLAKLCISLVFYSGDFKLKKYIYRRRNKCKLFAVKFLNWVKMQFPRHYILKGFIHLVFSILRRVNLFENANRSNEWGAMTVERELWVQRHVCVASSDSGECRAYRRPISRAKLFITEVHIRTSGRPTLRARLGGNYHFLWHRTQTAFEKWFLLRSDATETFRIRRSSEDGKITAKVPRDIAF